MNEMVIRIKENGTISAESKNNGISTVKNISAATLISCINKGAPMAMVSTGILPENCFADAIYDNGDFYVCFKHNSLYADISYFEAEYKHFPLPRLVFGYRVSKAGSIIGVRLGVIEDSAILKPDTPMYYYPFSNVYHIFNLCTGSNTFPLIKELTQLASMNHYILSMPNNNDYFSISENKLNMPYDDLLEHLKDKSPDYYYSDILIPNGRTLNDFINL